MVWFIDIDTQLALQGDNASLDKQLKEKKEENDKLKDLLEECRDGLEKIKHIGETKKLGAVYQVAERTLTKIDEALKWQTTRKNT